MSMGKWSTPEGEVLEGETPAKCAIKNLFQHTGLYASKVINNGTARLFLKGQSECTYRLSIFSTRLFSGNLKPNIEGEAKWFDIKDIPYYH